jgi:hypothetical protein
VERDISLVLSIQIARRGHEFDQLVYLGKFVLNLFTIS